MAGRGTVQFRDLLLLAAVLCCAGAPAVLGQALSLNPTPGWDASTGTLSVDISFDAQAGLPPAAVEWTLGFPFSQFDQIVTGPAADLAGKSVQCTGQYALARCVAIGSNSNSMPNGVIASVKLRVLAATTTAAPVMLSNVAAASPNGDGMAMQGNGASISVGSPAPALPPEAAAQTGAMAHVASGGSWKTTITLVNTGSSPAVAQMDFFDNGGQPLPLPLSYRRFPVPSAPLNTAGLAQSIDPGAAVTLETVSQDAVANEGWARLSSTGTIRGFVVFTNTGTGHEAAVPLQMADSRPQVLAFDNVYPTSTGLAIANLASSPAAISAVLRDDAGNSIGADSFTLPAWGHTSFMLPGRNASTDGLRGTVEFSSSAPFSAVGLRAKWNAIVALPLLTAASANTSIAHFAAGGGWTTSYTLVNLAAGPGTAAFSFYDNFGAPLSVALSYPQTGNALSVPVTADALAPSASLLIDATNTAVAGRKAGSAALTGSVAGFAIFSVNATGEQAVAPLETRNLSSYVLAYDNTQGVSTGVALASTMASSGYLDLTFYDESGTVQATASYFLEAHGHQSFMLADRFSMTAGRRGSIRVSSPTAGGVSMVGLRTTKTGTLTSLPVLETGI